ncbi:unnamed protein product, partial [Prorocentrum cordatum]
RCCFFADKATHSSDCLRGRGPRSMQCSPGGVIVAPKMPYRRKFRLFRERGSAAVGEGTGAKGAGRGSKGRGSAGRRETAQARREAPSTARHRSKKPALSVIVIRPGHGRPHGRQHLAGGEGDGTCTRWEV